MSAQANYFKLGLFVISATTVLVAGVITLGGAKLFQRTIVVETYMVESVNGIAKGSAVKYRGIEIGQVAGLSLASRKYDPDTIAAGHMGGSVLIELAIRADVLPNATMDELTKWLEKAVAHGLRARTASSGLTGPPYIELVFLDPADFPPPTIAWTPPTLYIPAAPSTMEVLTAAVQGILKKLEKLDLEAVITDADTLLKNANTKITDLDAKKLSEEASAFIGEIRKSNERLQEILNNPSLDPAIADLRETLENAKKATARIQEVLADPRVEKLMADMDRAGDQLSPALEDVRRAIRHIDRLVETQQSTIESALSELNQALKNINNITQDASENPSRILFGEPPPPVKPGANK